MGWAYLKDISPLTHFVVYGTIVTPPTFNITSSVTLYAIWKPNNSRTGGFDGGEITNPLQITCIRTDPDTHITRGFLPIYKTSEDGTPDLRTWLYAESSDLPKYLDVASEVRFGDKPGSYTDMYPFTIPQSGGVGIAVNHHFYIRKSFAVKGALKSYEGIIWLHGNGSTDENIGWGPRPGTPFIWLAEGGNYRPNEDIGGNLAASTLIIATNKKTGSTYLNIDPDYSYGHLECGNVESHGYIKTKLLIANLTTNMPF
jgi:hypothetical protein